ncbi:MAG: DUF4129 domain-containing protein [Gemmatimonadales bacterium]|nr:DUF4129 domain-containing protein [Gemmatimonadales bacterium]
MPLQAGAGPEAYRAVLDSVFATEPYRWAPQSPVLRLISEGWDRLGAWIEGLKTDNPLLFRFLLVTILLAWVGIFAHAAWLIWRTVRGAARADRQVALPVAGERHDAKWYSRAADQAAAAGRLAEALQLAFVALALTLEGQGLLQYQPSKTPAECAREARLAGSDQERLRDLVRSLYSYAFGGRAIGLDDYRRWREHGAGPWHAPAH